MHQGTQRASRPPLAQLYPFRHSEIIENDGQEQGYRRCSSRPVSDDPLDHIRERIALCRRLAVSTTDRQIAQELRKIADEAEADLEKLESERRGMSPDMPDGPPPISS